MSSEEHPSSPTEPATRRWGELLAASRQPSRPWSLDEISAVLRHQLSAPVGFDLGALGPGEGARLASLAAAEGLLIRSFRDLLMHPHPPAELLRMTKEFAKAHLADPDSPLSYDVALVLYYAAIVAGSLSGAGRLTRLPVADIVHGVHWALDQSWLDAELAQLFRRYLAPLEPPPAPGS